MKPTNIICILHSTTWPPSITFTSPSRSHLSILFFSVAAQDALCLRTRGFLTVAVTASLIDDNSLLAQRSLTFLVYSVCVVHESESTFLLRAKARRGKREPHAETETMVGVVRTGRRHNF
ncbi:uncharacterized protein LOC111241937 [Vigna radiata var. radiata]|uniref:Uncharacterized protein LOC111241937 n=1 Tax=Vigna radiata var. radiata TaxID=3916 RepID=A0A3Q0F7J8_VIGRR|nr:uncharacterized protein LOC111241937 [Vigna radiata var. radiata]